MSYMVAPTEPRIIRSLGNVSSVPERHGADILFPANGGLVAVQRKELSDLIASVHDGRLGKELQQMKSGIAVGILVVEGRPRWSSDGVLLRDYGMPWTRQAHRNLLYSVQANGVWVEATDDANDTVVAVLNLHEYLKKNRHSSLLRRPGPVSPWGKASNQEWAAHLLQGFDGVGPELAARIVEKFGRPPLAWTCVEDELREIKGLGPKKAAGLLAALA